QPFENLLSFTAWAEQLGRSPGQRTIEVARRAVTGAAAHELGLEPGTTGVEILRVRLLDGEPVMVERATFVEPVGRLLFDFDPDSASISPHLTPHPTDPPSARARFGGGPPRRARCRPPRDPRWPTAAARAAARPLWRRHAAGVR